MFKNLKSNKVVGVIIVLIIILVGFQIFSKPNIDRNSYVTLVQGEANLNSNPLIIKNKTVLKANDIIKTIGTGSLAIIEWGEGSITRIGVNTEIQISKSDISDDLTQIQILFKMLGDTGKTWSNVVSFIGEDSYFKQEFVDTEAAVRGTIFEVNLDNNYLFVEKHEVRLKSKKTNKEYIVGEKKPFDLKRFSFIELQKFILNFKDKTWDKINKTFDNEFFLKLKNDLTGIVDLKEKISDNVGSVVNLSNEDKEKLYNELLAGYQKIKPSSISPSDGDLYAYKLEYQRLLTSLAGDDDKKNILRTTIYDLKDSIDNNNFTDFENIVDLLGENSDFIDLNDINNIVDLNGLNDSFKESFNKFFDLSQFDGLGNSIMNNANQLKDGISNNLGDVTGNLNTVTDGIKNGLNEIGSKIFNK